jgi:hypothetical protein
MHARMVGTKVWQCIQSDEIPDGEYFGIWGGYEVTFTIGVNSYKSQDVSGLIPVAA